MATSPPASPAWQVTPREVIDRLDLVPHPEGGHYREILTRETVSDPRMSKMTTAFLLLEQGDFWPFRRVRSIETWYLSLGGPAEFHLFDPRGSYNHRIIARNYGAGNLPQITIDNHVNAAIRPTPQVPWVLMVCTISERRDFAQMTPVSRNELLIYNPEHKELIEQLTRKA